MENVKESPKWAVEFCDYLVKEHNLERVDAMCAVGELYKIMRKNRISDDEIHELATDKATDYGYMVAGGCAERGMISEAYRDGWENGYKKALI